MSRTNGLPEAVESRKRSTWLAVEAAADARERRSRTAGVALVVLVVVGVSALASRVVTSSARSLAEPLPEPVRVALTLRDTPVVSIAKSGGSKVTIERVGTRCDRQAVAIVGDREMLIALAEAGLPATLIRIGNQVQVAFHGRAEGSSRGEERPLLDESTRDVQNF